MAACDEGYRCEVCGEPVPNMLDSALYVRYVLREVPLHELFTQRERHLQCDPELAQYIVHEKFATPEANGSACKFQLSPADRQSRETEVTAAWLRLREVIQQRVPITEYPLPCSRP